MAGLLPLFPLNTVAFPRMRLPLHVFEDRYRALVRDLLAESEPERRLFGIVTIREGFEVDSQQGHSATRSMYRTGCVMQLTDHRRLPDGRLDIVVEGRHRMRVRAIDTGAAYLRAEVDHLRAVPVDERGAPRAAEEAARTLAVFSDYQALVRTLTGGELFEGALPRDPEALSYALGAACALPLPDRQHLLESPTTPERLALLRRLLVRECGAMRALPSLPATEVARSGWSPN